MSYRLSHKTLTLSYNCRKNVLKMGRKLTIKELAGATGQTIGTVNKHFERKKFRKTRDGLVDVDSDFNKTYIMDVTKGAGLYTAVVVKEPAKSTKGKSENDEPAKPARLNEFQELELRKKRSEVEISERRSELAQMELEKKMGNLLPVDITEKILVINLQAIYRALESEEQNITATYADIMGCGRKEQAEITQRFRSIMAKMVEKAEKDARHEIQLAVFEHQETRGRGEKKT